MGQIREPPVGSWKLKRKGNPNPNPGTVLGSRIIETRNPNPETAHCFLETEMETKPEPEPEPQPGDPSSGLESSKQGTTISTDRRSGARWT